MTIQKTFGALRHQAIQIQALKGELVTDGDLGILQDWNDLATNSLLDFLTSQGWTPPPPKADPHPTTPHDPHPAPVVPDPVPPGSGGGVLPGTRVPELEEIGPASYVIAGGRVRETNTGSEVYKGQFPLAYAMRSLNAEGGGVVHLSGEGGKVSIGGVFKGSQYDVPVCRDVTVLGMDGTASVTTVYMGGTGVWDNVRFSDVYLKADPGDGERQALIIVEGSIGGLLTLDGCVVQPNAKSSKFMGKGMKWGIRAQGAARYHFEDVFFAPAEEHSFYLGEVQGDSFFVEIQGGGNGRTGCQITNRVYSSSGVSGFGKLVFHTVEFRGNDGKAGGGSDFTVAGHLGPVEFVDCISRGSKSGAMAVWTDIGHGARTVDERGGEHAYNRYEDPYTAFPPEYSTPSVTIHGLVVDNPMSDRDALQFGGVGEIDIHSMDIMNCNTQKAQIRDAAPWNGPLANGVFSFGFDSQYSGWHPQATKVIRGKSSPWPDNLIDLSATL